MDEMEILTVGVLPKYRKQGVATLLFQTLFEYAKKNKIKLTDNEITEEMPEGKRKINVTTVNVEDKKSGAWHVKLNNSYGSFSDAKAAAASVGGFSAYIDYKYSVLVGAYDSADEAKAAGYGGSAYSGSGNSILISESGTDKLLFLSALLLGGCTTVGTAPVERPKMKLGCQLWGVKDFWYDKADKLAAFAEIFPKVKAMGYDGVQCGSFIRVDADGLEKLLKANGLAVADQPIAFDDVEDPAKLAQTVAFCNRFNVSFLYIPYFKGKTADEWRAFCRRLDSAEEKLRSHGIRVGYHHHDHELNEKVDGVLPWDILTGKDGARLELDIGPVLDTDHVPAAEIAKMSGRVPGIHAKPVGATAAGAAGERQDWVKVLAAAEKAGTKWFVVECERHFEDLSAVLPSYNFLKSKGLN